MSPAEWSDILENALTEHVLWEALLIFCAAYVVGALLMLPAWIFPLAAGAAFGTKWGIAASVVASGIANVCAFLITKHALPEKLEKKMRARDVFKAVDGAVKKEPFKVVALLRLSPVLPSGLKSYFLGLTCVRLLPYFVASAIGMLPGIALKAWVGDAGRDVLSAGGPMKWAVLAGGIVATVVLTWTIGKMARKRLGF